MNCKFKAITGPEQFGAILSELQRKYNNQVCENSRLEFGKRNIPNDTIIIFDENNNPLLEFGFGKRRAAALVTAGTDIFVVHSGRVHRDRQRFPSEADTWVDVDGNRKKFFRVSNIADHNFVKNLVDFSHKIIELKRKTGSGADAEPVRRGRAGAGPGEGGKRLEGEWEAKSSPIYKRLYSHLTAKGKGWKDANGSPWDVDLLVEKPGSGLALFEIKPDFSRHNVVVAIGELICYRSAHRQQVLSVIAAEGIHRLSRDFEQILREFRIETLDLGASDWKAKIDALLRERSRTTRREEMDRIAAMTPKGVVQTDSTLLIREDRGR